MEEVSKFNYPGSIMCKHYGTEGEARERALQGKKVVGSLGCFMIGRGVTMEAKRDLRIGEMCQPSCVQARHGRGQRS